MPVTQRVFAFGFVGRIRASFVGMWVHEGALLERGILIVEYVTHTVVVALQFVS